MELFIYKIYACVYIEGCLKESKIDVMLCFCPLGEGAIKFFCPTMDFYVRLRV